MITDLSLKILDRLNAAGIQTNQIDFKEIVDRQVGALERPAVNISVNQSSFQKVTLTKYKAALTISLLLLIQDVGGERERRFKIYDLIEAIIGSLILQDFGLNLQDPIRPLAFNNVTDKMFSDAGYAIYQIDFYSSFIFEKEKAAEDDYGPLRTIVSDYFLPGDGISDGQTIVTVSRLYGGHAWTTPVTLTFGGHANSQFNMIPIYGGKANSTY